MIKDSNQKFSRDHIWIRMIDDITAICGITDFGIRQLQDIVYIEFRRKILFSETGHGEVVASLAGLELTVEIKSPISGVITGINIDLEETPERILLTPYDDGWIFKIEPDDKFDLDDLLYEDEYRELCSEEQELDQD